MMTTGPKTPDPSSVEAPRTPGARAAQAPTEAFEECVMATLDANDIGRAYAARMRPDEFNQLILAALRGNGAPVEGREPFLKLARGVVVKMKTHPSGNRFLFGYLWLPRETWANVEAWRRENGYDVLTGAAAEGTAH
jgi:hypothetical protein